jgi:hypothetical protein
MSHLGRILIFTGIILIIAGIVIYFAGDKLRWLGNLPGDIRIIRKNVSFYFPITTMIIISGLFSFLIWLIRKIL